jgi:hypothetical protein
MASTTAMCTSFKQELLEAKHNFLASGGDTFKLALYTSAATHGAGTTAYSATNEITGTGYTAKGETLTNVNPTTSGTTAYTDFADVSWTTATFTAASGLIFNETAAGDPAVSVHDFAGDKSVTAGTFTAQFPTADASNAIIRIA